MSLEKKKPKKDKESCWVLFFLTVAEQSLT